MTEIWLLLSSMSSMTPSGPHSFIGTVPGGATRAPGGTQPAADEMITARIANNESRFAKRVIAALIAGLAGASQATHARKILFRACPQGVCLLRPDGLHLAKDGLTMTQTLFAVAVLAFGSAIPQMAAAQGTGGTPGSSGSATTTAAPARAAHHRTRRRPPAPPPPPPPPPARAPAVPAPAAAPTPAPAPAAAPAPA